MWKKYSDEPVLGEPEIEQSFATLEEAQIEYNKISKYLCKQLIEYESMEGDSNGDILEEDWNENFTEYHVCEDNHKFYIQTDPEAEEWIAEFNSEKQAKEYVRFLESKNE